MRVKSSGADREAASQVPAPVTGVPADDRLHGQVLGRDGEAPTGDSNGSRRAHDGGGNPPPPNDDNGDESPEDDEAQVDPVSDNNNGDPGPPDGGPPEGCDVSSEESINPDDPEHAGHNLYLAFRLFGASHRISKRLVDDVLDTRGLAELAAGDGSAVLSWIKGVAKIQNNDRRLLVTPVLQRRTVILAWMCKDKIRRGLDDICRVNMADVDDAAGHMDAEKILSSNARSVATLSKIKIDEHWNEWKEAVYSYLRTQPSCRGNSLLYVVAV